LSCVSCTSRPSAPVTKRDALVLGGVLVRGVGGIGGGRSNRAWAAAAAEDRSPRSRRNDVLGGPDSRSDRSWGKFAVSCTRGNGPCRPIRAGIADGHGVRPTYGAATEAFRSFWRPALCLLARASAKSAGGRFVGSAGRLRAPSSVSRRSRGAGPRAPAFHEPCVVVAIQYSCTPDRW